MTHSLEEIRQEHRQELIGPKIRSLLERVVRASAPAYPPSEYSRSGAWTREALEDILHDWVEVRLVGRKDLAVLITTAASLASLRKSLTTSFSQFLINQRRRTSVVNLFSRTIAALEQEDAFEEVTSGARPGDRVWTIAGGSHEKSLMSLSDLVGVASEMSDEQLRVIRYGPSSLKSSPILRNPELRVFLDYLLRGADGALDVATIIDVMKRRFSLVVDEAIEAIVEIPENASEPVSIETEVLASSIKARLTQFDVQVLMALDHLDGDLERVSEELDQPFGWVKQSFARTLRLIADYADSEEQARSVYRLVLESLF